MIQEIYGLGAYYLLREDEEEVFARLMLKYHRIDFRVSEIDSQANEEEQFLALLIRKTLSHRKSELITAKRGDSPRKASVLSAAAGSPSGTADKGARRF
jgi:hypothetical protein